MPVGRFEYNPGVQSTVAQTFARNNQLEGQAVIQLIEGLTSLRQQHNAKVEATKHAGRAADAFADALEARGQLDENTRKQLDNLGADARADWMRGKIAGEETANVLQTYKAKRDEQETERTGGLAISQLMASTAKQQQAAGNSDPKSVAAAGGSAAAPKAVTLDTDLLLGNMSTLPPESIKALTQSKVGMQFVTTLLQDKFKQGELGTRLDSLEQRTQQQITSREGIAAGSNATKTDIADANREQRAKEAADKLSYRQKVHEDTMKTTAEKLSNVPPAARLGALSAQVKNLVAERSVFGIKPDKAEELDAKIESLHKQIGEAVSTGKIGDMVVSGSGTNAAPAAAVEKPAESTYKSADDVKADFQSGKLTKEAAKKILKTQFNIN